MGPVLLCVSWECSYALINQIIGGMYGNFAGRDASRGMAKQSFDEGAHACNMNSCLDSPTTPEMLTPLDQPLDKLEDLKPDEMYAFRNSLLSEILFHNLFH
jgi:hypothetical protein